MAVRWILDKDIIGTSEEIDIFDNVGAVFKFSISEKEQKLFIKQMAICLFLRVKLLIELCLVPVLQLKVVRQGGGQHLPSTTQDGAMFFRTCCN